ncbi:hypothetical protein [Polluticaenibacter yanchengensis]|uniref:MYM-type domain-containing protein n=1 Tax=Polluticaenibacter yanchengensis TaxID=3014562 RepID=A0ABT4UGF8_9BACT|nr:hypothetical protein [Chitinophagaceae bacterium LY-5]
MRIVITEYNSEDTCKCQFCEKIIASFNEDTMTPPPEKCYKNGNIPIPNFGWFCSQICAEKYEKKYTIRFVRQIDGRIDYYADEF